MFTEIAIPEEERVRMNCVARARCGCKEMGVEIEVEIERNLLGGCEMRLNQGLYKKSTLIPSQYHDSLPHLTPPHFFSSLFVISFPSCISLCFGRK